MKQLLRNIRRCLNHEFLLEQLKNYRDGKNLAHKLWRGSMTWKDMLQKCVERYCELANKKVEQLHKSLKPLTGYNDQFKQEELESVGELSEVCSQIVLKCLYLARLGRPDILWFVNKPARSVTKWTQACDSSDLAGDLEDSKSTPGGVLRIFGSRTLVPASWMCKEQTSVSHSSTESEIISLDAG